MLSKLNRIGNKGVIEKLFTKGSLYKTKHLIFKFEKQKDGPSRFAVSVSKKVYKSAVKRNQLRRQIYDAIRLNLPKAKQHLSALIIVRNSILDRKPEFGDLEQDINTFFNTNK